MRCAGPVVRMGEKKWIQRFVVEILRKKITRKPGQRWGNNGEVLLEDRVRNEADWIHLLRDSEKGQAFVIMIMNTLVSISVGIS